MKTEAGTPIATTVPCVDLTQVKFCRKKGSCSMKVRTVLIGLSLVAVFAAATWAQRGPGYRSRNLTRNPDCPLCTSTAPLQELSTEENGWLLYMREEEKLALDVYAALYEKWGLRIFRNIAASEKQHFDAIGTLIARYELEDTALSEPGAFSTEDFQNLYESLVEEGGFSIAEALGVGVKIETMDIDDLHAAIDNADNRDILSVYANLLNGSENHLDAFNSHLEVVN
jgi:hypothetical protein